MIDLHTHILPGVDDGARTLAESVEMAATAARDGVRVIAATPHQTVGPAARTAAGVEARVQAVADAVAAAGLDVQVVAGMEAYLDLDLPAELDTGRVCPLAGGRYVLVELPMHHFPNYAEQVLFDIQRRGYVPIIAHPERNRPIQRNPELLQRLVEREMLTQLTAGSLTGVFGPIARDTALSLLRSNLVHLIASDAHAAAGPRGPALSAAVKVAEHAVGEARARALVRDNPAAIIAGRSVICDLSVGQQPRRSWQFWK